MSVVVKYRFEAEEVFDGDHADEHGQWLAIYKAGSAVALVDPSAVLWVKFVADAEVST